MDAERLHPVLVEVFGRVLQAAIAAVAYLFGPWWLLLVVVPVYWWLWDGLVVPRFRGTHLRVEELVVFSAIFGRIGNILAWVYSASYIGYAVFFPGLRFGAWYAWAGGALGSVIVVFALGMFWPHRWAETEDEKEAKQLQRNQERSERRRQLARLPEMERALAALQQEKMELQAAHEAAVKNEETLREQVAALQTQQGEFVGETGSNPDAFGSLEEENARLKEAQEKAREREAQLEHQIQVLRESLHSELANLQAIRDREKQVYAELEQRFRHRQNAEQGRLDTLSRLTAVIDGGHDEAAAS